MKQAGGKHHCDTAAAYVGLYLTARHTMQTEPDGYRSIRSDVTTGIIGTVNHGTECFSALPGIKNRQ